jgi:hypothetical protein
MNPFDLANYKPQISMRDASKAARNSYQQTAVVNQRRAKGVEPCAVHLPGSRDDGPKRFVAEMPEMPKYDANAARRRRRAEKGQT